MKDTLKSPPPESQTMKKASMIAVSITTVFYLCCGCSGYAAFGNQTPGNLLTGFGFYEPYWLIDFANACVVLHLVGGYQVICICQNHDLIPLRAVNHHRLGLPGLLAITVLGLQSASFAFLEGWLVKKYPNNCFVSKSYTIPVLPFLPACSLNLQKLCLRTAYVLSTTGIAMLFPYFNQVLGVLGGLIFWPLAIYFPVEMYFVQRNVGAWTRNWVILQIFRIICLLVALLALIGSIEGLISVKLS
ncbi:hypothetical protein IFM89_029555 [Coptis chinensis]|uniref:Amino acid transporter transmembrane domain-containing protein n=1 Tax=Coptis chinensis TaxID=261450 RepID=A0A835H055_9MAGN|nr:hypothetical protein IFM89_029555 [Coptis chinensis]